MVLFFHYSEYPIELHDSHVDYPLAPEQLNVHSTMLSPTQFRMLRVDSPLEVKPSKIKKLIPNLFIN